MFVWVLLCKGHSLGNGQSIAFASLFHCLCMYSIVCEFCYTGRRLSMSVLWVSFGIEGKSAADKVGPSNRLETFADAVYVAQQRHVSVRTLYDSFSVETHPISI